MLEQGIIIIGIIVVCFSVIALIIKLSRLFRKSEFNNDFEIDFEKRNKDEFINRFETNFFDLRNHHD